MNHQYLQELVKRKSVQRDQKRQISCHKCYRIQDVDLSYLDLIESKIIY